MKHIERKLLLQKKCTDEELIKLQKTYEYFESKDFQDSDEIVEFLDESHKDNIVFVKTDKGYLFPLINQKIDGKKFSIPMPDPTLIYFNNAQSAFRLIKESKENLKIKLNIENLMSEVAINEIYNFFGLTSQFAIFLFTSIESFVNQMIPVDYNYKKVLNHKTEFFNSEQVQRYLSFNDKLKKVLPECSGKDFFKKQTPTTQHLDNLKKFRDEIVHTKKDMKNSNLFYDSIVTKSFSFKYEKTIKAVQTFMNFYKPDYVVECKCGSDF